MQEITLDTEQPEFDESFGNPVIDDIPSSITAKEMAVVDIKPTGEPKIITEITSAAYGGFTKIISLLTSNLGKTDVISIRNGHLSAIKGTGHLYCDLSPLFGDNHLDIIDPQYNIKLMRLISGGDSVVFIDDPANDQYHISNIIDDSPQINITLKKPGEGEVSKAKISRPSLGKCVETLDNLDPELVSIISNAEKATDAQSLKIELLEEDGEYHMVSIATDNDVFKYDFKDISDKSVETTTYKIYDPFPIPKPDEIKFEVFKADDGEIWIKTSSEIGMATIDYSERARVCGEFDTFKL